MAYYEDDSVVIPVDDNRQMFLEHQGDDHTMLITMRLVRDDEDLKSIAKTKAGILYSDIKNKETYWENNLLFVNKSLFALADGIERARRPKTSTNDSALPITDVIERNWFEKLPLHWRYIWYMSGGMVIGFMINYVL